MVLLIRFEGLNFFIKNFTVMDELNEKNIERILNSMEGSNRAKPRPNLLQEIEQNLYQPETKIISLRQLRLAAAAVLLLLVANVWAIQNTATNESEISSTEELDSNSLIADYNLYEL